MPLRRRIILTRRVGCSVALSYYLRRGLCLMDHSEVVFFRMIRCAARNRTSPGFQIHRARVEGLEPSGVPRSAAPRPGHRDCCHGCYILRRNPRGYPDLFIKT